MICFAYKNFHQALEIVYPYYRTEMKSVVWTTFQFSVTDTNSVKSSERKRYNLQAVN